MESNRQAGVELDALVATKVMGWTVGTDGIREYWRTGSSALLFKDFNPSTTWEGMRLVVEEMQRRGLQVYTIHFPDGLVSAQVVRGALETLGDADSQSAPIAVCNASLAALKALEADTHE